MGQFALVVAGDDDEFQFGHQGRGQLEQFEYFAGLARVGDDQHQIVLLQDAQVAVLSLAGVEKHGRDTGRAEGGGDVHGNLSGLAHAAGHEFAPLLVHLFDDEIDGLFKLVRDGDIENGLCLFVQDILYSFVEIHIHSRLV